MTGAELAITARRCRSQLLSGEPARSPVEVTKRLLAVQAQDPRGARLAVRSRSAGLHAADVDRALTRERTLVITWLNRGTLHLVCTEDYWWLHALTSPRMLTGVNRRLAEEGVPPAAADQAVTAVAAALQSEGPLTRAQLRDRLTAAGVRTQGQAMVHILALASIRGLIIRGPVVRPGEQAFALVKDWLGEPPALPDRDQALAALARRYLAGHAPATDRDLAKWSGLALRDARAGLAAAGYAAGEPPRLPEPPEPPVAGPAGADPEPGPPELPPPRLLGPFDPLLLGWESRRPILGAHQGIVTVNGLFRPFALAGGRAVGTWSMPAGQVQLAPFGPLSPDVREALQADAADVRRFLAAPG